MPVYNRIAHFADDMTQWRRSIHENPELGYEEVKTAALVAEKLASFGVDQVVTGLGKTGVVGVIKGGPGKRSIGLRADMDALPMSEEGDVAYKSKNAGRMHACGHDGHTTMLLGAARYLAETRNFDGTVYVIFQPAEEGLAGARAMIQDGLFDKFPMDAVYGMHNWPGMQVGHFAIKHGTMMAAADRFDVTIRGRGCHAAQPHNGIDPVFITSQIVGALQSIASRFVDPAEPVVVSVTEIKAGSAYNVIPETAYFRGTIRTLTPETRKRAEELFRQIVNGVAATFGAAVELQYHLGYPPTVNESNAVDLARRVARDLAGDESVHEFPAASMGGEDFAFMLEQKPGSYILVGNGTEGRHARGLHNASYDFNDAALPVGASYWAKLVETALPKS
ncbi:M20 aminoacylase family protein [Roseiterribacter gracilis]|uniref:Amidohydrolase n=1 Tax=Roseiterribacter gracilis TaxID=2812848 RepID=A0A8S8XE28_9PROT|nr:amidohydrolase [Rhodospirillales bacterium TMPK1]